MVDFAGQDFEEFMNDVEPFIEDFDPLSDIEIVRCPPVVGF